MDVRILLLLFGAFVGLQAQSCDVKDPFSCAFDKREVCIFGNNGYSCQCPTGVGRSPGGTCQKRDECSVQSWNDCHSKARCVDEPAAYTCQCNPGYTDISKDATQRGRICALIVSECDNPTKYNVDCDQNAACVDTAEAYTCRCLPGFSDVSDQFGKLPGRRCVTEVNECSRISLNECDPNAICTDSIYGYTCKCRNGYVDVSTNVTHYPGRSCKKPTSPIGGTNECSRNDCSRNAICSNVLGSFKCQCKPGYLDVSGDPVNRPGRRCKQLINECGNGRHDCSPYANCIDTREGYACQCKAGYTDISSTKNKPPGRLCHDSSNECALKELHTCDENAVCIDTTGGYTCRCNEGYFDVSHMAHLPNGRVCTLYTSCPRQATDLMFLVDGSGSIGSYTFKQEVLRFIKEFLHLFDIGQDKTRVSLIQFSDKVDLEFAFNKYNTKEAIQRAIDDIEYQAGLTQTGKAIDYMTRTGFSSQNGVRPASNTVARVAVVITDGRSQDLVAGPAEAARAAGIQMFSVGVTNHADNNQLLEISGSPESTFHVEKFTDLDTRLRSAIQKHACPDGGGPDPDGPCDPNTHEGCRHKNKICIRLSNGEYGCACPDGFVLNPITDECGGKRCDPELKFDCPEPEACEQTRYGVFRCACPRGNNPKYYRDPVTGKCTTDSRPQKFCDPNKANDCPPGEECKIAPNGRYICICTGDRVRNAAGKCVPPGWCDPNNPVDCDSRLKEECLPDRENPGQHKCQCPPKHRRHSVTKICLIDECAAHMDDCTPSPRGICTDTDDSYLCRCASGYLDHSLDLNNKPGRICDPKIDECEENLDNCSDNAFCYDVDEGFICTCKPGFTDFSPNPQQFAGIICKEEKNECLNPADNDCHRNAKCENTKESYTCECLPDFIDTDEFRNPGRNCEPKPTPPTPPTTRKTTTTTTTTTTTPSTTTTPEGSFRCEDEFCFFDLNEECVDGKCVCKKGMGRQYDGKECLQLLTFVLPLRVLKRNNTVLYWHSDFADQTDPRFIEIKTMFEKGINQTMDTTYPYGIHYHSMDVNHIFPPRVYNHGPKDPQPWNESLIFNYTIKFTPPDKKIDYCDLWDAIMDTIKSNGLRIGGTELYAAKDQPDPCAPPGQKCADDEQGNEVYCNNDLGEVCLSDTICGCPKGQERRDKKSKCENVEGFQIPLWVMRKGFDALKYNQSFNNTNDPLYQIYVTYFETGVGQAYQTSLLKDGFIVADVTDIIDPSKRNGTWDTGIFYNATAYFKVGYISDPERTWNELIRVVTANKWEIGQSDLFINEFQVNPHSPCYRADCHKFGYCIRQGITYTCRCKPGHIDLSVGPPGRQCIPEWNYPDCSAKELNNCSINANCLELPKRYNCSCMEGYDDMSPGPTVVFPGVGTKCVRDSCYDVNYCTDNQTCVNKETGPVCECKKDFVKISGGVVEKDILEKYGLVGIDCLHITDVNECDFGLHIADGCSHFSICTNEPWGYKCRCPDGYYEDEELPGRACSDKSTSCGLCNDHGRCVHSDQTHNITCECHDGYSGTYCEIVATDVSLVLLIILAILFLLLTCCLCMFLCAKCRCIKDKGLWAHGPLSGIGSTEEGKQSLYGDMTIPRAKLRNGASGSELDAGQLGGYLGGSSYGSDSGSEAGSEYTVRRTTTTVTRTVLARYGDEEGGSRSQYTEGGESRYIEGGQSQYTEGGQSQYTEGGQSQYTEGGRYQDDDDNSTEYSEDYEQRDSHTFTRKV